MNQPDLSTRIALAQLEANKIDYVTIPGTKKKVKLGFLHDYTVQKITELLLEREEIEKVAKDGGTNEVMRSAVKHPYFSIKMVVLAVLNSPLKIALIYPIKWRWWAFVKRYNEAQMASMTMAIQKKNNGVLRDVLSHYHILDGYEDGYDESDEGGSRAIPSRTHAGRIASFVKDYPCYGDSRWIPFVGRIVNYTARCVLTVPQIQMMQTDLPHTLFLKGISSDPAKNTRASDDIIKLQEEANKKMLERKAAKERGEIPYDSVDEIFNFKPIQ